MFGTQEGLQRDHVRSWPGRHDSPENGVDQMNQIVKSFKRWYKALVCFQAVPLFAAQVIRTDYYTVPIDQRTTQSLD
jgi:hypothetical protein